MLNISSDYRCIFCLSGNGPFKRKEHIIPESLGNDDFVLRPGLVCDPCNQYFGTEVEQRVLNSPPFSLERIAASVKTKKGRLPNTTLDSKLKLSATGFLDSIMIEGNPDNLIWTIGNNEYLIVPPQQSAFDNIYFARFFLKIGLEALANESKVDVYSSVFDKARNFARFAKQNMIWDVGYAIYPNRDDLIISERSDEIGPLVKHQLYQYEIGQMFSGDFILSFVYRTHIFACNLTSPDLSEYVRSFNLINDIKLKLISQYSNK